MAMRKASTRSAAKAPALSPLLRSAFEVLEHGLYHYLRSTAPKDMKFALLHIDQAIELLLKERVRLGGRWIYKNPKETITIHGAYDVLQNDLKCVIPESRIWNSCTKSATTSSTSTPIPVPRMRRSMSRKR